VTAEEFLSIWQELQVPSLIGELEASEIIHASGIWLAKDYSARQHLLVQVPDDAKISVPEIHGLGVSVGRHRIPEHTDATYIDLACLDQAVIATFAAFAADIAQVTAHADPVNRLTEVVAALNKWRWFWGVNPANLSTQDALGLFGELWFLLRWAGATPESVQAWEASTGSRHDFQWLQYSVEVKTTSRSGPVVHSIQHLEQLETPETGDLYLYSLRVARDALASNTLTSLVNGATRALSGQPDARADLLAKLSKRGYTPAERDQSAVRYRVIEEGLYRVTDRFPRLTRASFPDGLPTGVDRVSYQLDMTACVNWLVGTQPDSWPPHGPACL
jgi:hypothetical protein